VADILNVKPDLDRASEWANEQTRTNNSLQWVRTAPY